MAKNRVDESTESRAKHQSGQSSEYTSPGREVLNSALSLVAVIGITLVGGALLKRIVAHHVPGE